MKKSFFILIAIVANGWMYGQEEKLKIEGAIVISNSQKTIPDSGTVRWTGIDFEGWTGAKWISLTKPADGVTGLVSDIDDNKYITIQIGMQTWIGENLRATRYNDGKRFHMSLPIWTGRI